MKFPNALFSVRRPSSLLGWYQCFGEDDIQTSMETLYYLETFLSTSQSTSCTDSDDHSNMKVINLEFRKSDEVLDYLSQQLLVSEKKFCSKKFYIFVSKKRIFYKPLREVLVYLIRDRNVITKFQTLSLLQEYD